MKGNAMLQREKFHVARHGESYRLGQIIQYSLEPGKGLGFYPMEPREPRREGATAEEVKRWLGAQAVK